MTTALNSHEAEGQETEAPAPRRTRAASLRGSADLLSASSHATATAPAGDADLAVRSPEEAETQRDAAVREAASLYPRGRRIALAGAIWAEALADQYRLIDSGRGSEAARRALGCDFSPERAASWLITVEIFRGSALTRTA